MSKTEGVRLADFGVKLLPTGADAGVKQIVIAKILKVKPSAVTQQLDKA
ncbi:conserved hypothetical protein [Candidatus Methylobacter favarea]|uniref:Uncharacterized protein n=1 Tax=Candidatus Methylobacter favarea TaxID=2707345 RepID=A0A8S0WMH3_9GAMM|nr:hypothetical protein [Candidatus Methylobacter favarea]CAA9889760.1 conserved hypothetical protein [Candidatus Methylobacter favarea]